MKDIESYDDLLNLVTSFYAVAKKNEALGPIFNRFVDDWDDHANVVASFWEVTLFNSGGYRGNPMLIHQKVDQELDSPLVQNHFDTWVKIWCDTIDAMFSGESADKAKQRASNIANIMYIKIYKTRS